MIEHGPRPVWSALSQEGAMLFLAIGFLLSSVANATEVAAAPLQTEQTPDSAPRVTRPDSLRGPMPSATPWLDEVRAQRQASEARRKNAREAFEARRRANDPWGAAHQEAWEEDVERRREARRQRRDQERERFRELGPPPPPEPWQDRENALAPSWPRAPTSAPYPDTTSTGHHIDDPQNSTNLYPPGPALEAPYYPKDWDNLWYYRGY